jgi:hypothetical protein
VGKAPQSFAARAKYTGPRAYVTGEEVDHVPGFYALDEEGRSLILRGGKPVRLIHVDLAPEDPDDGREEYLIAGPKDPPQSTRGRLKELEPERVTSTTKAGS